jgi:hypothetical protein
MTDGFAILSPYLIPPAMRKKKVNLGDGFILRAIERRLGTFENAHVFTSRAGPDSAALNLFRRMKGVILGGANQLDSRFSVWPGATARDLRESGATFVPFGIGINGEPEKDGAFSDNTQEVIEAIHERIEFSSWRCGRTTSALEAAFPHLKGRFLMTGCPVLYDAPLLEGSRFSDREDKVAVTVTERGDFWEREASLLKFVARRFPRSVRTLVLHQDFEPPTAFETWFGSWPGASLILSKRARLRVLARKLGYEIVAPATADACIRLYEGIDLHIGSRLHAHLLFLSRNKRSFLLPVDGRSAGFAEFLGFPLVDYRNIEPSLAFDFEIVRSTARKTFDTMELFVGSVRRLPC